MFHRDLKADNIFIKGNHIKIGDFGIAMNSSSMQYERSRSMSSSSNHRFESICSEMELDYHLLQNDMFDFGVILFDMCHPQFYTPQDRKNVLDRYVNGTVFSPIPSTKHCQYIEVRLQSLEFMKCQFIFIHLSIAVIEKFIGRKFHQPSDSR